MILTPYQIFLGLSNKKERDGRNMWHVWERSERHASVWSWNLKPDSHCTDNRTVIKKGSDVLYRVWIGTSTPGMTLKTRHSSSEILKNACPAVDWKETVPKAWIGHEGKEMLDNLDVDVRIKCKLVLRKLEDVAWTGPSRWRENNKCAVWAKCRVCSAEPGGKNSNHRAVKSE